MFKSALKNIAEFVGEIVQTIAETLFGYVFDSFEDTVQKGTDGLTKEGQRRIDNDSPRMLAEETDETIGKNTSTGDQLKRTKGNKGFGKLYTYPIELQDMLNYYKNKHTLFGWGNYWLVCAWYELSYIISMIKISAYEVEKYAIAELKPERPDVATILNNQFRRHDLEPDDDWWTKFDSYRDQTGFDQNGWNMITDGQRPILQVSELLEWWRRNQDDLPDDFDLVTEIQRIGYTEDAADKISEFKWNLPGASDIVRFMVREAYYDDYVEKWGADQESKEEYKRDCRKVGLNDRWANLMWYAHWDLPSLYQGYEMLHRDIIDCVEDEETNTTQSEELNDLFKAHDILPGWRDKLMDISWRLPTRVDIRRMWRDEVFNTYDNPQAALENKYKQLGYNMIDRKLMVLFTLNFYEKEPKEFTKKLITDGYKENLEGYTYDNCVNFLQDIDYSEAAAYDIMALAKLDLDKEELEEETEIIKRKFLLKYISEDEAMGQLFGLGHSSNEMELIVLKWKRERIKQAEGLDSEVIMDMKKADKCEEGDNKAIFDNWLAKQELKPQEENFLIEYINEVY